MGKKMGCLFKSMAVPSVRVIFVSLLTCVECRIETPKKGQRKVQVNIVENRELINTRQIDIKWGIT